MAAEVRDRRAAGIWIRRGYGISSSWGGCRGASSEQARAAAGAAPGAAAADRRRKRKLVGAMV